MEEKIERCVIFLKEVEEDIYSGKCRCHEYEITLDNIGRVSESFDRPLNYCDRYVAFKPSESWTELRAWFEELIFWENQRQKDIKDFKKNHK